MLLVTTEVLATIKDIANISNRGPCKDLNDLQKLVVDGQMPLISTWHAKSLI